MSSNKNIDIKEFVDEGYLQELNRQFLHPLGLALEVLIDTETNEAKLGNIWDYRNDPEGIVYYEDTINCEVGREKARKVQEQAQKLETTRIQKFGWRVQPIY